MAQVSEFIYFAQKLILAHFCKLSYKDRDFSLIVMDKKYQALYDKIMEEPWITL